MHTLNDTFSETLAKAKEARLLLDFDGTLAPFQVDPMKVQCYPGVKERLEAIQKRTNTKLYLISGRGLDTLKELMPKLDWEEVWGSHGAERLTRNNAYWRLPLTDKQVNGLAAAKKIQGLPKGAFVEEKPLSVAVHYRGALEQREEVIEQVLSQWKPLCEGSGLVLHFFNGGIEIRPQEMSKAYAVSQLLEKDVPIAYLGDDATDEEAFSKIGDRGLKVLVRSDTPEKTLADVQLTPPKELLEFFDQWLLTMER